ncbi:hypothetical protein HPB50_015810 [Hyalomma asiaticum]|uniref:Uncharacterized protein n=1 Tax=Hyalomma asiaticum TaxID=266040 RepID=A0ACB7RUS2_HYAAI|nr:hypothetical protein HPB50_015810 [Hyalomma asiaticum]
MVPPQYSDDSDLGSSDDEPENAGPAQACLPTDCQDEMSSTLTTDDVDDELQQIAKPSKNHPTWSVFQGSVGPAMPERKDVPLCTSLLESPIDYFRRFFDMDLLSLICEQSSLYSAHRNPNKVTSMTVNDLKQFCGHSAPYVNYEAAPNAHVLL